jgi:organic radical activating enzyme
MQNREFSFENRNILLNRFFEKNNTFFETICFTGGEPSLNMELVNKIAVKLTDTKICDNLNFETNGILRKTKYMQLIDLYNLLQYNNIKLNINLSDTKYHNEAMTETGKIHKAQFIENLKKFKIPYNTIHTILSPSPYREATEGSVYKAEYDKMTDFYIINDIYLNTKGELVHGSQWSYNEQKNNIFGTLHEWFAKYTFMSAGEYIYKKLYDKNLI